MVLLLENRYRPKLCYPPPKKEIKLEQTRLKTTERGNQKDGKTFSQSPVITEQDFPAGSFAGTGIGLVFGGSPD